MDLDKKYLRNRTYQIYQGKSWKDSFLSLMGRRRDIKFHLPFLRAYVFQLKDESALSRRCSFAGLTKTLSSK
jgi:hypothetical protein